MRIISSSRKGSEPNHTHYCPQIGARVGLSRCQGCEFLSRLEAASVSHTVYCEYPADDTLFVFEPSGATDVGDLPRYMGADPFKVRSHTWVEQKIDGARAILHFTARGIRVTGKRRDQSGMYSEFSDNVPQIRDLPFPKSMIGTVLDAEMVVVPNGASATGSIPTGSLGATMSVVGASPAVAIETQRLTGFAHCYVFDVVSIASRTVLGVSFEKRRKVIETIFANWNPQYLHLVPGSQILEAEGKLAAFQQAVASGYEGLVLKDPSAPYGATYSMIKVKDKVTIDPLVTGFDYGAPGSKYANKIGALRFSVVDAKTHELVEVGKVIPGDDSLRNRLTRQFEAQLAAGGTIADLGIVIEVEGQSWTKEYRIRHPRILRFRVDKSADLTTVVDFDRIIRH